ncbi:gliding motility-associated C-terminal domain-containing protein [Runella slithyformis]|uniref:T9SS type B sorting domain-containing protein n=1 Tax=Runella slithyformis (strain ATCC 29530 / DSM 19594 / LMG 11500 / NCIMB 11436 / LSU 4) TaxID=761193 RepID=A0A7U4E750_RUNSL|nr:gliding motility-associated C-terminal domain-containing protein [Runella slithyformis]AEI50291.1 hypothetical protein Runsl_3937 [Runella slithyformis DSM 19594]
MIYVQYRQFISCCLYLLMMGNHIFSQCPKKSQFGSQWVDGNFGITGKEVGTQCTGRAVTVTTPSTLIQARYIFDYKTISDTSKAISQTSFTYSQPGYYCIVQIGFIDGKPSLAAYPIQVYSASKPTFNLSSGCSNSTKLQINTMGLAFGQYQIDWGDGKPSQTYTLGQPAPLYTYGGPGNYQVKVTGEGTGALVGCTAISDPQSFEVLPVPAPISEAVANIRGNTYGEIYVTLPNTVKVKHFSFEKNGSEFIKTANIFIDSTITPTQSSACYRVSYTDICDQKPDASPTVCTIHLKMDGEMLKWSSESPFTSAVSTYFVEKLNATGQVVTTYKAATLNEWLIDPTDTDVYLIYRIRATSADGQTSFSNPIRFRRSPILFVPDTFSPNNDLLNDTFDIEGQSIEMGEVFIYDRWGNTLFHTMDWKKSWDGTDANGRNVPAGFYTYRIEYTDAQKNTYSKLGSVLVLR